MKTLLKIYPKMNLGDDLFAAAISQRYPDVEFYVNSAQKNIKPLGLNNVRGKSVIKRAYDKICHILTGYRNKIMRSDCEAEIVLGGSMFIEHELKRDELADEMRRLYDTSKPLFIIGANFGPFRNDFYYDEHKRVFSRAIDVCFRDRYSADLFKDLKNVRVAPDVIFGLNAKQYKSRINKTVVISVINLEGRADLSKYADGYETKIAEISEKYAQEGYRVILMSFCKAEGDEGAISRILQRTQGDNISSYYYDGNIDKALKVLSSSEIIIGTRFHAVVLGLVFQKKLIPIIYSNKTKNMLNDIDYKGKMLEIDKMSDLDISKIDDYLYEYGDVSAIGKEAEKHFGKLDKFLEEK